VLSLDDPRLRLNHVLDRYEEFAKRREGSSSGAAPRGDVAYLFDRLVRETIRPAMEEAGEALRRRGHEYEILIAPGSDITMHIYPASVARRGECAGPCIPHIAFIADASSTDVHVVHNTVTQHGSGRAEIAATVSPDQVTRRYVTGQICDVLGNLLDRLCESAPAAPRSGG
jgi:hypothetical protein